MPSWLLRRKPTRIQSSISSSLNNWLPLRQMECRVYYCQRLTRCRISGSTRWQDSQLSLSTSIAILTFFISRNIGRVSSYLTSTKASNLIATNNPYEYEVYFIIYGGRIQQCHGICIVSEWKDTILLYCKWWYSTTAYSSISSYTLYSLSLFVVSYHMIILSIIIIHTASWRRW